MASRKGNSYTSGCSSTSKRGGSSKIRCDCGREALIKTVRNGPNLGMKFYGCPLWPDTQCEFFKWVNEQIDMEEQQMKLLEKDTLLLEMEVEQKIRDEKIKKLQLKKQNLEEELKDMKNEVFQMKSEIMNRSRNERNLYMALFVSWIVFVVVYVS
uniref:GRF-type domain-containing protein n=1 Tax=Chenopodium quinoa TaxID=63459 RepID=A0A803NBA8_CHEQI